MNGTECGSKAAGAPGSDRFPDPDLRPAPQPDRRVLRWTFWLLAAAVAVAARLAVAGLGSNYDFASYTIVAKIVERGGNVYAETNRYNYGPIWFHLLHALRWLAGRFDQPIVAFGYILSGFLALVDLAIGAILLRRFGRVAALCFLFNPVSILISGYHRQFDALALLLGLLAVLAFDRARTVDEGLDDGRLGRRRWLGLGALGASLVTKHVLFAFPFWLAVRQRRLRERLLVLLVPVGIFFVAFAPYVSGGLRGIVGNVFLYRGRLENPLLLGWLPAYVVDNYSFVLRLLSTLVFLGALAVGAWLFKGKTAPRALLFYTVILVAFSPSVANQYLAIVVPFVSVYRNPPTVLYTVTASLYLLMARRGLHLATLALWIPPDVVGYQLQVGLLLAGLVWAVRGPPSADGLRRGIGWLRERVWSFFAA